MAIPIGRNTRVEVEQTLDVVKPITGITKASTAVVTSATHGYANGDVVVLENIVGMTELDGQIVRVANVAASTYELEGIDSTLFGTFTSGGGRKISAWQTLGEARSVNAGSVSLNRLDASTLLDSEKQYVLGQPDTPEISFEALSNPFAPAAQKVEAAARSGAALGFRLTLSDNSKRLFRGLVSLPAESIPLGALATATFSATQIKRRLAFLT
jgi:hypothetical protein